MASTLVVLKANVSLLVSIDHGELGVERNDKIVLISGVSQPDRFERHRAVSFVLGERSLNVLLLVNLRLHDIDRPQIFRLGVSAFRVPPDHVDLFH